VQRRAGAGRDGRRRKEPAEAARDPLPAFRSRIVTYGRNREREGGCLDRHEQVGRRGRELSVRATVLRALVVVAIVVVVVAPVSASVGAHRPKLSLRSSHREARIVRRRSRVIAQSACERPLAENKGRGRGDRGADKGPAQARQATTENDSGILPRSEGAASR